MHIVDVPGILPDGSITCSLPRRDDFLPAIYKLPAHPRLQDQDGYPDQTDICLYVGRTGVRVEPIGPDVQLLEGRPCPVAVQEDVKRAGEYLLCH